MVRGAAKEQARQKAQKKAEAMKGGESQLKARAEGLKIICPSCKIAMPGYKILVQHMESKHPSAAIPAESSFAK
ncbi:putative zinc finger protein [Polychytrium aggregatum]|uniref:putative zinc finger protein n=1 Tax=Polychytrium aggregatum TaxID=110093 RepID=UPI0022FECABB|nr:putative zinc finger protein [Polychytrium aggregatum]KAI9207579.1 putative zinc finger protein [Polychytrium aggregatum]